MAILVSLTSGYASLQVTILPSNIPRFDMEVVQVGPSICTWKTSRVNMAIALVINAWFAGFGYEENRWDALLGPSGRDEGNQCLL